MEAQMAMECPSPEGMPYGSISFMPIPLRREWLILDRVAELSRVLGEDHEEGDLIGSAVARLHRRRGSDSDAPRGHDRAERLPRSPAVRTSGPRLAEDWQPTGHIAAIGAVTRSL